MTHMFQILLILCLPGLIWSELLPVLLWLNYEPRTILYKLGTQANSADVAKLMRNCGGGNKVKVILVKDLKAEELVHNAQFRYQISSIDSSTRRLLLFPMVENVSAIVEIPGTRINAENIDEGLVTFKEAIDKGDCVVLTKDLTSAGAARVQPRNARSSQFVESGCSMDVLSLSILHSLSDSNKRYTCAPQNGVWDCTNTTSRISIDFTCDNATTTSSLTMAFSNIKSYWRIDSATLVLNDLNSSLTYEAFGMKSDMSTPLKFSYSCKQAMFSYSGNTSTGILKLDVNLHNLKLQPFLFDREYGTANHCTGFFTAPIWMAIFAISIHILILIWGISKLSGIKVMERFDDPRGKKVYIADRN